MKRPIIYVLIVIVTTCMMSSCGSFQKGEEQMEEQLMTKEELLKFIEENQDLETVDITVDDLDGIDIDDFIAHWHFREDVISSSYLRKFLDSYLEDLENKRRAAYMAQELICVDSTDAEYSEFKDEFLSSVGGHIDHKGNACTYLDRYYAYFNKPDGEEAWVYLYIGQTKYLDQFSTFRYSYRSDDHGYSYYKIHIPIDSEGMVYEQGFCYNKNQKYFMVTYQSDHFLEIIKVFAEMG